MMKWSMQKISRSPFTCSRLLRTRTEATLSRCLVFAIGNVLASWIIGYGSSSLVFADSDPTCAEGGGGGGGSVEGETIELTGPHRALFIFARFPDGLDIGPGGSNNFECTNCGPGWPTPSAQVPVWADSLLEDTVPPEKPGSLSHFFYEMSQGTHQLKGYALNQVILSNNPISYWVGAGGLFAANKDIVEQVAALPGLNLADFDLTGNGPGVPDGVVDYIFIYWQSTRTLVGGNVVSLAAGSYSSLLSTTLNLDSVTIKPSSGSTLVSARMEFNSQAHYIRHRWMVAAVAAHEYGHDLVGLADIVSSCNIHITTESRYGIMNGNMTPPVMMMSGLMRYKLGWIHPDVTHFPSTFPFGTTLTLSASYEDGDDCFALVETHITSPQPQYFLLEARKSNLPGQVYNAPNPINPPEEEVCCYPMRDVGDGLLIAHIRDQGSCCFVRNPPDPFYDYPPPILDVEVATGRFIPSTSNGVPDPILGLTRLDWDSRKVCAFNQGTSDGPATGRIGDLFKPMEGGSELFSNVFAPFTNPNTNLYIDEPAEPVYEQSIYSGISFYDIKWVPGQNAMEVKLRIDNPAIVPGTADTLRTNMEWDGLVQLTGDLVVPSGVSLTIKEGSVVVAKAQSDRLGGGLAADRVELIGVGPINVQGTAMKPVKFISSRSPLFKNQEFRNPWALESATAQPGDWYGYRNKTFSLSSPSAINYTNFEFARYAVSVDSTGGTLFHPQFTSSDSADIFLTRDTKVSSGSEWNLDAPTSLKATPTSLGPDGLHAGKVDLVVDGTLRTQKPVGGTGWVTFTSTTQNASNGDDWGGITVTPGGIAEIRNGDLGYAIDPIHFLGATNPLIADSKVHHYQDQGILDTSSKAEIVRCKVERGAGFNPSHPNSGIKLIASAGKVEADTVLWHRNYGISAEFSESYCNEAPPGAPPETLFVRNNVIQGAGPSDPTSEGNPPDTGIYLSWLCKHVVGIVEADSIRFWSRGASLYNCSDTRLTCVGFWDNYVGLQYERNCAIQAPPAGGYVLIELCKFKSNFQYGLRIPKPVGLVVGWPDHTFVGVGLNSHKVDPFTGPPIPSRFVNINNWTGLCYSPPATYEFGQNAWFNSDGSLITLASDVTAKIDGTGASKVRAAPLLTGEVSCLEEGTLLSLGEVIAGDKPNTSDEFTVSASFESPSGFALRAASEPGRITIDYDIPNGPTEPISIAIYDVAGRKVTNIHNLQSHPGYHSVYWKGEAESGNRAAVGIYFVVLRAREFQATQKVLLVGE